MNPATAIRRAHSAPGIEISIPDGTFTKPPPRTATLSREGIHGDSGTNRPAQDNSTETPPLPRTTTASDEDFYGYLGTSRPAQESLTGIPAGCNAHVFWKQMPRAKRQQSLTRGRLLSTLRNNSTLSIETAAWDKLIWLNISGADGQVSAALGTVFKLPQRYLRTIIDSEHNGRTRVTHFPGYSIIEIVTLHLLKPDDKLIPVELRTVFFILLRKGGLITIQNDSNWVFGEEIQRGCAETENDLVRTEDPSIVLLCLLDSIVQDAREVARAYQTTMVEMGQVIQMNPTVEKVKLFHMISYSLALNRRKIEEINQLLGSLEPGASGGPQGQQDSYITFSADGEKLLKAIQFRMALVVDSLEKSTFISEDLKTYTFSVVNFETNRIMRGLTVVTVLFLPLTFLTRYFGMNFGKMQSVQDNSEATFWFIATPVMMVVIGVFFCLDVGTFMPYFTFLANAVRKLRN